MNKDKNRTLSDNFRKLVLSHYSFLVFFTLPGVFINTFLLEKSNISVVLIYNIIVFVLTAISMHFSPVVMRRFSVTSVSKIGVLLYAFVYLLLLIMMDKVVNYYYVIAILTGVAAGFYWLGYNTLVNDLSTDNTRDKALGILNIGYSIANMIIPLFSGYLLSIFKDLGYFIIFAAAALIALLTIFLYARLPVIKPSLVQKGALKRAYLLSFKDSRWRICFAGEIIKGIREGSMTFILSVALFSMVKDEFLVGLNSLASGIAAVIASILLSKIIRPENRILSMSYAVSLMMIISIILIISPTPSVIVFFSIANSLIQNFLLNPSISILYSIFEKQKESQEIKSELFAVRELALDLGRGIGIAVFLFLPNDPQSLAAGILGLTVIQYLTVFLNKITVKQLSGEKK